MKQTVLITGVADFWGARLAGRLAQEPHLHVVGVDTQMPPYKIEGLDFIQTDIRNPLFVELLREEKVQTVCHLAFRESRRKSEADFDLNVMGTMKVFGAAAEAGVQKIIQMSSTAIYGAAPHNPAFLPESWPLNGSKEYGYIRYRIEIEEFSEGFAQQFPHMTLTTLRFANILGPTVKTPLSALLSMDVVPTLLGFTPMMQLIHEDDVVEALAHAIAQDVPGTFNVAALDPVPLEKMLRLMGNWELPLLHPLAYVGVNLLAGTPLKPLRYFPLDLDYLRYRWVADVQKMQEKMGFMPQKSAVETIQQFAQLKRGTKQEPADALDPEQLRHILEQRKNKHDSK